MKFLADQNFPQTCTSLLGEFGHELLPLQIHPERSASDDWIFNEAQKVGATLLTTDKDFFHTVPWLYSNHKVAVIIALSRANRIAILNKLRAGLEFIKTHEIENHVLLLSDRRMHYLRRTKDSK